MTTITSNLAAIAQAATADTVVTIVARDGLQTAADVAQIVLSAFAVGLLLVLVVFGFQLRKLSRVVRSLGKDALRKADPIVERGQGVADNVEFISAAIRSDVEHLSDTVKSLTDRLQQASDHMEGRIEEFNALMEVVQDEAEDIFLGTAATARGVREGVRALNGRSGGEPGSEPAALEPPDEDEVYLTEPRGGAAGEEAEEGDATRPAGTTGGSASGETP